MTSNMTDLQVEETPEWLLLAPEGVYREVDVSLSEDQFSQLWQGYACAWCFEPWHRPWPKVCTLPGCWSYGQTEGHITEAKQKAYILERFGGEKWFGITAQTYERWQNLADKLEHPRKGGIVIP